MPRLFLRRLAALAALSAAMALLSGCTTTLVLMYVHEKLTEGAPPPCHKLNSVERALSARCGPYVPGSLQAQDISRAGLPLCPLTQAAREPRFWPVLPELLAKGAVVDTCAVPPLVALAHADPCPDFTAASPEVLQALHRLADGADAVHHDTMRLLSCPNARAAGLDTALDQWLARGWLPPGALPFGPLGALHPTHLHSPLAAALEAGGHTARAGLGSYRGHQPSGFEEALRTGQWAALDWWLTRVPELANQVPPRDGKQVPWVPLARVVGPKFIDDPVQQEAAVRYLLTRGAHPGQRLPHDASQTVLGYARRMNSPWLPLLESTANVSEHRQAAGRTPGLAGVR
jgi:hypothetical protein